MISNPSRKGVGIARSILSQPSKRSFGRIGIDMPPRVGIDIPKGQPGRVPTYDGHLDLETFRRIAFKPQKPISLRTSREDSDRFMPAFKKWFKPIITGRFEDMGLTPYMSEYASTKVPYELLLPSEPTPNSLSAFIEWLYASPDPEKPYLAAHLYHQLTTAPPRARFIRFIGPLGLLIAGLEYNQQVPEHLRVRQLYVAQAPLDTLPQQLQDDIPPPDLVTKAGVGDIYSSSLWMGLEPTYTPWHQDPNPNLFYQLYGSKIVRLLPPRHGRNLFNQVKSTIGGDQSASSSTIRGEEMMEEGEEKQALFDSVWGKFAPEEMRTIRLARWNSLFIPKGWWHSFRSEGSVGRLNASVNWWFR